MMFRYIVLFVGFMLTTLSLHVSAQVKADTLEIRNKLELEIRKSFEDLISTKLDMSTFTVAVRVQVKEASKAIPPKKEKNSDSLPAGMGVGLIDVRELVESYERQMEELKLLKENAKEEIKRYDVTKISIVVGLDVESYDEKYRNEFKAWLVKKVKTDYGALASGEVSEVSLISKRIKPSIDPTPEMKPFDWKDLLPIIGAALLMLGMIATGYLVWSGLKANASARRDLVLAQKEAWALKNTEILESQSAKAVDGDGIEDVLRLGPRDLDHVLGKIAMVCLELGNRNVNELVRVWVDSGQEGLTKSAILIDALLAARERIMTETGKVPELYIPLDRDIIDTQEEALVEEYRRVAQMKDFERFENLEKIYWDLVSVKTLGLQSLRRPFDFLQSLNVESLDEVFRTQKDDARALALMYLPESTRSTLMDRLDEREKEKMLFEMLQNSQISQRQIWDFDTSMKVTLINQSAEPTEKLVNLFPRTIEVLQSLDAYTEIGLLRRICPSLADQGAVVKKQYTTLAFFDEWRPDFVKKLVSMATSNELVCLIKALPEARDLVLSACSEKTRAIVEDDIKIQHADEAAQLKKNLISLKGKWLKKVSSENISMSKILKEDIGLKLGGSSAA